MTCYNLEDPTKPLVLMFFLLHMESGEMVDHIFLHCPLSLGL